MRSKKSLLALAAVTAAFAAPQAGAQERGVHLDPGSPAGKEYAIPIERARREASGGSGIAGATPVGTAPLVAVPLFGEGITKRARPSRPTRRKHAGRPRGETRRAPSSATAPPAAVVLGGTSGTGWTAGLLAAVILAGGLVAVVMRRGARRSS